MSEHELSIEIDRWVRAEVVCKAKPDAECRTTPECGCEAWDELKRDEQGWFHTVGEDGNFEVHRNRPADDCNICNWLNADDPLECLSGSASVPAPVVTIPIEPVWVGDFYEWKPVS